MLLQSYFNQDLEKYYFDLSWISLVSQSTSVIFQLSVCQCVCPLWPHLILLWSYFDLTWILLWSYFYLTSILLQSYFKLKRALPKSSNNISFNLTLTLHESYFCLSQPQYWISHYVCPLGLDLILLWSYFYLTSILL